MPRTKKPTKKEIEEALAAQSVQALIRELRGKAPVSATADKIKEYCKTLYPCGWNKITVTYNGSGDSCDEFCFKIYNEEDEYDLDSVEKPPREFMKKVEDAIWDLLPSGFENNEGGQGEVTIDIESGKITIEHDQFYMESTHTKEVY